MKKRSTAGKKQRRALRKAELRLEGLFRRMQTLQTSSVYEALAKAPMEEILAVLRGHAPRIKSGGSKRREK